MTRSLVRVQQGLPNVTTKTTKKKPSRHAEGSAVSAGLPKNASRGSTYTANMDAEIEAAIGGRTHDLFRRLEIASGLPGPRANEHLAIAFAHDCARFGARVDPLVRNMASMSADDARGGSPREFLVMCGVLASTARALDSKAQDKLQRKARAEVVAMLEEHADDLRFRVREAVAISLAMLGAVMKSELAFMVEPWMDRYFHAAAVALAISQPSWLETFAATEHELPIQLLHQAFLLAHDAPRSAERYPGHKALIEALAVAPGLVARRFPQPMFEQLATWAAYVKVPELRDAILQNIERPEFKKSWGDQIKHVQSLIEQGKAPPRDPTIIRHGTRGRGKKRRQF